MKKEQIITLLEKANVYENSVHNTQGVSYYDTDLDFCDISEEDKSEMFVCQLLENDILLVCDMDRSQMVSYLEIIGKNNEQIQIILDLFYRYNNLDLDYFYFGTFKELFEKLGFEEGYTENMNSYTLKKETLKILRKIFNREVSLKGYEQNRDIRYGDTVDQLDFEEEAFKEDSKRMSEYTTADSYELTENYVCSYYNTISLSVNFLRLMGINRDRGFKCTIESGKDLQVFNRIALEAIKNMRLMRISGIETFVALCQKLCVEDGYLTKSSIELFNSELNSIIQQVEDPECYKYIMMDLSDLTPDMWDYTDCVELYSKICRMLDLTQEDIFRLIKNKQFVIDILDKMNIEITTYYDDNLDMQEDEEYIPIMAE